MLYLILFSGFCAVFTFSVAVWHFLTEGRRHLDSRMRYYVGGQQVLEDGKEDVKGGKRLFGRRKDAKRSAGGKFLPEKYRRHLGDELIKAALPLRAEEFFAAQAACGVICGIVGLLLFRRFFMFALLFLAGLYLPVLYLNSRKRARSKKFDGQIADALVLMSNSLKAGYSFLQAMEMVSREAPPPICEEFGRALKEMSLGVPVEEALHGMNERVGSEDLDMVITAVLTQRQVGGNLSEVLDKISYTIRERVRIRGEIRTLTAQGKMSGFIIGMLPFVLAVCMFVMNRSYLMVLFESPLGLWLLGGAIFAQIIGALLIRKIISIEV